MSKTSAITHPVRAYYIVLRSDYLLLCQDAPDMHCAALLLDRFEQWTNSKLDNDLDTWIYMSLDEMVGEIYHQYGRNKINKCLLWLCEMGWLDKRDNPKNNWDKTLQYKLNYREVNSNLSIVWDEPLDSLEQDVQEVNSNLSIVLDEPIESVEQGYRQVENNPAIPKTQSKIESKIESKNQKQNAHMRESFFCFLKNEEQKYSDGKLIDPLQFPIDYNAIFWMWYDTLVGEGLPPGTDHKELWAEQREGAVALAKDRRTPQQVADFIKFRLQPNESGTNWYRDNARKPRLSKISSEIGAWLEKQAAAKKPAGTDWAAQAEKHHTPSPMMSDKTLIEMWYRGARFMSDEDNTRLDVLLTEIDTHRAAGQPEAPIDQIAS